MDISRNAPCPCGSGLKYKRCCLASALKGIPPLRPDARELVIQASVWEMDLVPVPMSQGGGPDSAIVVVMVEAEGFVLLADIRDTPGPEPEHVAAELAGALTTAAQAVGQLPPTVRVGDPDVAASLSVLLDAREVEVISGPLTSLSEPTRDLLTAMADMAGWPPAATRERWSGWGKTPDQVAELFHASATFYRAAPWRVLESDRPILAATPGGRSWTLVVLGAAGEEFGLAFYSEMADYMKLYELELEELWAAQEGRVYGLTFDSRDVIPRKMQREVASSGWEVASTEAFPSLMSLRSPAGGIRQEDWDDVVTLLSAVPRFVRQVDANAHEVVEWHDPETEIIFLLLPAPPGVSTAVELQPGGAEGPGADSAGAISWAPGDEASEVPERDIAERFEAWLVESGLARTTVKKHRHNVDDFLYFLGRNQSVPIRAVHERDLREFLFDWVHRKSAAPITRIRSVPASLTRFFEFLELQEQIYLPWAPAVLADRDLFWIRWHSRPFELFISEATREWMVPLTDDLHERAFLPDASLGENDEWGDTMGPVEWDLHTQLSRLWLMWRDDVIRGGVTAWGPLVEELCDRQKAWQARRQASLGGRTPIDAVREERDSAAIRLLAD